MKKGFAYHIGRVSNGFEIAIAIMLLLVIAVKAVEACVGMTGSNLLIIDAEFKSILSAFLGLVIGVEFVKMLCKHTAESVVDVLLFTIARQLVVYHESMWDILIGVAVIAAMFAVKKYLIESEQAEQVTTTDNKISSKKGK